MSRPPAQNSKLILAAMIFAVSMTFIAKQAGSELADAISQGSTAGESPQHLPANVQKVVDAIPHDFALASRSVFYGMAAVMAVAFVIALARMPAGKVEEEV